MRVWGQEIKAESFQGGEKWNGQGSNEEPSCSTLGQQIELLPEGPSGNWCFQGKPRLGFNKIKAIQRRV